MPEGKDFNEDLVLLSKQLGQSQVSEDTDSYEDESGHEIID